MSEQSSWSDVGERLEAVARKLKTHFEQSDRAEEVPDTLQRIRNSVSDAFEHAGNAARDDDVRSDLREAGRLFVDALSDTFSKVSENLRERAEDMKQKPDAEPEPPKPIEPSN